MSSEIRSTWRARYSCSVILQNLEGRMCCFMFWKTQASQHKGVDHDFRGVNVHEIAGFQNEPGSKFQANETFLSLSPPQGPGSFQPLEELGCSGLSPSCIQGTLGDGGSNLMNTALVNPITSPLPRFVDA